MTFDQLQDIEGIESQKEALTRVKRVKTVLEPWLVFQYDDDDDVLV